MKKLFALLSITLTACGTPQGSAEATVVEQLQAEVDRITPQLLVCEGGPADSRENQVTGQPQCSLGDSVSYAGFASLYGGFDWYVYLHSTIVIATGQPFRHPSALTRGPWLDDYSRDQILNLAAEAMARGSWNLLRPVRDYARGHDWQLCENSSDGRCYVTPLMRYLVRDVLGESVAWWERDADIAALQTQADLSPLGFELFLTAMNAHLRVLQGRPNYFPIVQRAYERQPSNLYYAAIAGVDISERLLVCLQRWQFPGWHHTFWKADATDCDERPEGSLGWELVSLARWVIRHRGYQ